ncbi:MAG TPA: c-type cytochrome domain-containing protein [Gemmataceae bacterium]|nr:c-type cytochrome domain-containing protein [Gemmataceae bacterium]
MALLLLFAAAGTAVAQQPPSYARQVRPFFAKYCLECHNAQQAKGDLNLETFSALMKGGKSGPVVVPGKPDESLLVLLPERKEQPAMPPKTARQPKPNEVAVLRAWVAAGAKDDSASITVAIPDIKPRADRAAPVTALAYRPDGKLLAVGGHREVLLIDVATGDVAGTLPGQAAQVTALAFSPDGRRLAVAGGAAGVAGEVRLYAVPPGGLPSAKPEHVLAAHQDLIYDLAFSPDGKLLATGGYDRLIKLWDVAAGKELRLLRDHSDTVYGLAFSADGRLLASGAADRAVKVWEVATGKRLYTLSDPTDWIYAVAWSPDGRHLAAGGVDRSIRVWEVTPQGGRLVHSVFAHEAPVMRLIYAADGKMLYSLSEDRTAKAWDAARMVELRAYPAQPESVLALAVRPDHKELALGRYDGALVLLDEGSGKAKAQPLPAKPKPPQLGKLTPSSGRRGQTIRVTFEGKYLDGVTEVVASVPDVTAKLIPESRTATAVQADVTVPAHTLASVCRLSLKSPAGQTAALPFLVDLFPAAAEKEPNDSPATGQKVDLPVSIAGSAGRAGDIDCYRFRAEAGQQIGVQAVTAAAGSKLVPHLRLTDPAGQVVAESSSGFLGHTCTQTGVYALSVHDRDYGGGADMHYRLHVGDIPVVTAVFPLGLQRGTETEIQVEGVNLAGVRSVRVKAPADAQPGTRLPVSISTPQGAPLGNPSVVVGEFAEVVRGNPGGMMPVVPVPGTANGRIDQPGTSETWRFRATKGQRLIIEVNARRLGSPLDSVIEILDAQGQPVPRAVLRCLARTYVTFRDHDSATPKIRLEAWNELAVNDYVLVGGELLRIKELPPHPDADCLFFNVAGQRVGFLDTTPTHHSMGVPMYKVSIHPPGSTFPPNGFPVFALNYRNDDGGPGYGKDSRLFFDPPADGEYQVRIADARAAGGSSYAYRLTIRPPRPDFKVSFSPTAPVVWRGGAVPVNVTVERLDGFNGRVDVRLENVPMGCSAPATNVLPDENTTALAFWADPDARGPSEGPPLKLVARAVIDGKEAVREATGGLPKVVEPGEILCTTEQSEVTLRPGGTTRLTVTIERRNGFTGRVPLDVRGLPHGVRVLDIGLNGILITEKETRRTIELYAEPWVPPTEHPIVVLARREGKDTEHAAKSVLLRITGK